MFLNAFESMTALILGVSFGYARAMSGPFWGCLGAVLGLSWGCLGVTGHPASDLHGGTAPLFSMIPGCGGSASLLHGLAGLLIPLQGVLITYPAALADSIGNSHASKLA